MSEANETCGQWHFQANARPRRGRTQVRVNNSLMFALSEDEFFADVNPQVPSQSFALFSHQTVKHIRRLRRRWQATKPNAATIASDKAGKWIILHSSFFILHSSFFTLHSSLFILHSSLFTLHSSLFVLHSSLTPLPPTGELEGALWYTKKTPLLSTSCGVFLMFNFKNFFFNK